MQTLYNDLEKLRKLNDMRERAFELRNSGHDALRDIAEIKPRDDRATDDNPEIEPDKFRNWQSMANKIEAATLLKIKRHWRLVPRGAGAPTAPFESKINVGIDALFVEEVDVDLTSSVKSNELLDRRVSVLVAAHCMELRSEQSATALSLETILCYYRILVEMNLATWPDWTVGAARAGEGATVTSFVTGECVRAIMAFQRSLESTAQFLRETRHLYERHEVLLEMSRMIGDPDPDHPLTGWSNFAMHRIWLDWFIATQPDRRALALDLYQKGRFSKAPSIGELTEWFKELRRCLSATTVKVAENFAEACRQIESHNRATLKKESKLQHKAIALARKHAREFGLLVMETAVANAEALKDIAKIKPSPLHEEAAPDSTRDLPGVLEELEKKFTSFFNEIGRVLDVSKHYVESVLDRALADPVNVDIGELAFAAAAYGSATDWQSKQRLTRVCQILLQNIPPSGVPVTRVPFHSTRRGYKLLPTGFHIVGSLALLLTKTGYEFDPEAVEPLLHAIDSRKIIVHDDKGDTMGWNFEGSPRRNSPSVWVTGITVLALDRMIRMFDARINGIVFDHFNVELPERVRNRLTLNDLVYPDYGLTKYTRPSSAEPMSILLERLRAHVSAVGLPAPPEPEKPEKPVASSLILHGPPGTGKTTWAEALARSAEVPLVRLSPFDLIATPRGPLENVTIQTRARQVFEALSMLTKAVILFDEFESVFLKRGPDDSVKGQREEIAFLQTGLLPMLNRLHDVAAQQNLVYCLNTNYLPQLDDAVKRQGRFDVHLEVDHPDPLSRAGTFLYRLASIRRALRKSAQPPKDTAEFLVDLNRERADRLVELIRNTRGHAISDVAGYFNLPKWASIWSRDRGADQIPPAPPDTWKKDVLAYASVLLEPPQDFEVIPKDDDGLDSALKKYETSVRTFPPATSSADAAAVLNCLAFRKG